LKVTVRLHATLRRTGPEGIQSRLAVELEEGATVASLLRSLALDVAPEHLMVVVNRRRLEPEHRLEDGDEVDLFPPISGGIRPDSGLQSIA
jgi:molybdopterin converting factor small subunit